MPGNVQTCIYPLQHSIRFFQPPYSCIVVGTLYRALSQQKKPGTIQGSHVPPQEHVDLAAYYRPDNHVDCERFIVNSLSCYQYNGISRFTATKRYDPYVDSNIFSISTI